LLIKEIEKLVEDGKLNKGQGNSLIKKLETAKKHIEKGKISTAINLLNAFKNEVNSMIKTGKLSSTDGQKLLDAADLILSQLG
jgi:polyhydroxyalkanoate synthesis regulator phasin